MDGLIQSAAFSGDDVIAGGRKDPNAWQLPGPSFEPSNGPYGGRCSVRALLPTGWLTEGLLSE